MEQETWNLWSFRRWLFVLAFLSYQFQENGCCIFDSSATMPCAPESFEGGLVLILHRSLRSPPGENLNERALIVLPGQHPFFISNHTMYYCNSKSKTIWITWHLSKNIIKHIIKHNLPQFIIQISCLKHLIFWSSADARAFGSGQRTGWGSSRK